GIIAYPLTKIDVAATALQGQIKRQVPVTEHEEIDRLMLQHLIGISHQPLLFRSPELLLHTRGNAAVAGPAPGDPDPQVGMETGKKPLAQRAAKDFFKYFIAAVPRPQTIPVMQIKRLTITLHQQFVRYDAGPQFIFEITKHP